MTSSPHLNPNNSSPDPSNNDEHNSVAASTPSVHVDFGSNGFGWRRPSLVPFRKHSHENKLKVEVPNTRRPSVRRPSVLWSPQLEAATPEFADLPFISIRRPSENPHEIIVERRPTLHILTLPTQVESTIAEEDAEPPRQFTSPQQVGSPQLLSPVMSPMSPPLVPFSPTIEQADSLSRRASATSLRSNHSRSSSVGPKTPRLDLPHGVKVPRSSSAEDLKSMLGEKSEDIVLLKIAKRDDSDRWRGWRRIVFYLMPITAWAGQGLNLLYLIKRIQYTLTAQNARHKTFYAAWVFLAIEIILNTSGYVNAFWQSFLFKPRKREALRLLGDAGLPFVDVLVWNSCAGEPTDEVMDTVKAAADMDYPRSCFRVLVCDDKASDELKEAVENWQRTEAPHLAYQRRVKIPGVPHHAKAGNINAALEKTATLGKGEFVASFDADMIPERHMLRSLLPHLVVDDRMALAGAPQAFYNVPNGDPLNQDLANFFQSTEPLKDVAGIAWCTGSGFIMRRAALDDIGGFPTGTLAEDVCCSSLMIGRGWKTSFVNERLQFGTVPDSLAGHLKQRTRWTVGTIQSCIKLNWFLGGEAVRQMNILHRMSGLTYGISSIYVVPFTLTFIVFPFVFFSGGTLVPVNTTYELKFLIWVLWGTMMITRLHEIISALPGSWIAGKRDSQLWTWMAPITSYSIIRMFLPKWLGGKAAGFTASGSIIDGLHERDAQNRAGLLRRMRVMLIECKLWIHVILVSVFLSSIFYSIGRTLSAYTGNYFSKQDTVLKLLITVSSFFVATYSNFLTACVSFCIPLIYMLMPPSVPERAELLSRDGRGIAHPKPEYTQMRKWSESRGTDLVNLLVAIYTTFLFIATFTIHFEVSSALLGSLN